MEFPRNRMNHDVFSVFFSLHFKSHTGWLIDWLSGWMAALNGGMLARLASAHSPDLVFALATIWQTILLQRLRLYQYEKNSEIDENMLNVYYLV